MIQPIKNVISFPEYDFPCRLFDFNENQEIEFPAYRILEKYIRGQLYSTEINELKDGLSNVLYWGYQRIGYGPVRLKKFRENVKKGQLLEFKNNLESNNVTPRTIKNIGLPQFSGFSFISKILMFLNPEKFVVLDKKIMELQDPGNLFNPLSNIPYKKSDSGIRISKISEIYYLQWCNLCALIASQLKENLIAVDIERGFFKLVEHNKTIQGREIISFALKNMHFNNNTYF